MGVGWDERYLDREKKTKQYSTMEKSTGQGEEKGIGTILLGKTLSVVRREINEGSTSYWKRNGSSFCLST